MSAEREFLLWLIFSRHLFDMNRPPAMPAEPAEPDIRHTAYLLWLESGRRPGRDLENWFTARELLRHRHERSPGFGRRRSARPMRPASVAGTRN